MERRASEKVYSIHLNSYISAALPAPSNKSIFWGLHPITYIRAQDIALVFGITILMSIVASFMPINRVARVEPATVFRA